MKKILLLIPILLLLTGCNMTYKQMLDKQAQCEELNLDWVYTPENNRTWERIECVNKEKK